jgi:hypothetical protein
MTASEFYRARTIDELHAILCGGVAQRDVFRRFDLTTGEHISTIMEEVGHRARENVE